MENENHSQHARVRGAYYVRFCPEGELLKWDISIIMNISEDAIMFHSENYFKPGARLDVIVQHPSGDSDKTCTATVIRCGEARTIKGLYEVAIDTEQFDNKTKEALKKTIEDTLKKRRDFDRQ